MAVQAGRTEQLELPATDGPWSWRVFTDEAEAWRFFHRLQAGDPPPRYVAKAQLAPDGSLIPRGSWLVLYRPIIAADARPADVAGGRASGFLRRAL